MASHHLEPGSLRFSQRKRCAGSGGEPFFAYARCNCGHVYRVSGATAAQLAAQLDEVITEHLDAVARQEDVARVEVPPT